VTGGVSAGVSEAFGEGDTSGVGEASGVADRAAGEDAESAGVKEASGEGLNSPVGDGVGLGDSSAASEQNGKQKAIPNAREQSFIKPRPDFLGRP